MTEIALTTAEVSRRLGYTDQTYQAVIRLIRSGRLAGFRLSGRYWRVMESDLEAFITHQRAATDT
jgi:excisionase family DNA binding protein